MPYIRKNLFGKLEYSPFLGGNFEPLNLPPEQEFIIDLKLGPLEPMKPVEVFPSEDFTEFFKIKDYYP